MIRLSVNYSKKVPGEQEYSSVGASCKIEIEQSDVLMQNAKQLRAELDALYAEAREAVDRQIAEKDVPSYKGESRISNFKPKPDGNGNGGFNGDTPASNKQISYLVSLGKKAGVEFKDIQDYVEEHTGKRDLYKLTRKEASSLIEQMKSD